MISTKEKILRKIILRVRKLTGVSPNGLSFIRIFATPWITLFVIEAIKRNNFNIAVISIVVYALVVLTDFFDGPLARVMQENGDTTHDVGYGGVLDRVGDKLLIIFPLLSFGINPFVSLIIIGESLLAYQALSAKTEKKKQSTYIGKIKMLFQTFLMPVMLVNIFYNNNIFSTIVVIYLIVAVIFTILSVISHYRK